MTIRTIQQTDYPQLTQLYKSFFPKHNIFQKDNPSEYLKKITPESFLICEENNQIQAALILVLKDNNETHTRWKLRHFAFTSESTAKELLEEAEKRIKEASKTAKIELTLSENEPIEFYKKQGYEQEGILKNHYRYGEDCFVLGKSFN